MADRKIHEQVDTLLDYLDLLVKYQIRSGTPLPTIKNPDGSWTTVTTKAPGADNKTFTIRVTYRNPLGAEWWEIEEENPIE